MFRKRFLTLVSSLALVAGAFTAPALAQTQSASLPPALQAAVNSGNANQIAQVIRTLGGGDPARTATLAQQVVAAAERMLTVNPTAAVAAAQGALTVVAGSTQVQNSAPAASNAVATTAARIFVSPQAIQSGAAAGVGLTMVQTVLANQAVVTANPGAAQQALGLIGGNSTAATGAGGGGGSGGPTGAGGAGAGGGAGGSTGSGVGGFTTGQGSGNGSPDGR